MLHIRTMTIDDYDSVIELMKKTPGVSFRDADSREATLRYLRRNEDLSFVALRLNRMVGSIMSGHDGRRGHLQHLVVDPEFRRHGVACELVSKCLDGLQALGIMKSHIDVFRTNELGQAFWESQGWKLREDIYRYSFIRGSSENA
jgi:N-acetylglutamate synthase